MRDGEEERETAVEGKQEGEVKEGGREETVRARREQVTEG